MPRFRKILLVNDGLSDDPAIFRQAVECASGHSASLSVVTICPAFDEGLRPYQARFEALLTEQARGRAFEACAELSLAPEQLHLSVDTQSGAAPATRLVRRVLENGHDLLIKRANVEHKRGFNAIDMELLRKCPCPVWLNKNANPPTRGARVAVAIDPEGSSPQARPLAVQLIRVAASLAERSHSRLEIVSAWDFPYEMYLRNSQRISLTEAELESMIRNAEGQRSALLDSVVKEAAVAVDMRVSHIRGGAARVIAKFVEDHAIALLVMGTVGRTGLPGFIMGNTAEDVLLDLDSSLLALKPEGFVSPVKA